MGICREDRSFLKIFTSDKSSESFAIPLRFNEYFPDPLPVNVELLVPGGGGVRSWTIRMKKRGEQVFLTLGWVNFVKEHNLENGKFLNFNYDCDRTFRIIIFGQGGSSEFRAFPQVVIDAADYEIGEEEEEE